MRKLSHLYHDTDCRILWPRAYRPTTDGITTTTTTTIGGLRDWMTRDATTVQLQQEPNRRTVRGALKIQDVKKQDINLK